MVMKRETLHKLKFAGDSVNLKLLRRVVLRLKKPLSRPRDEIFATSLQRLLQWQYLRAMRFRPDNRREYTYSRNCMPVGYNASPVTNTCNNPKMCPWCFVRLRLRPIYTALMTVPAEIRKESNLCLVGLDYRFGVKPTLIFPPTKKGFHGLVKAHVTAQMLVPRLNRVEELVQTHYIFQVVPKDVDAKAIYTQRFAPTGGRPTIRICDATPKDLINLMAKGIIMAWEMHFNKKHTNDFLLLRECFKGKQLLRINRYKPKLKEGEESGDRITTVPEEQHES